MVLILNYIQVYITNLFQKKNNNRIFVVGKNGNKPLFMNRFLNGFFGLKNFGLSVSVWINNKQQTHFAFAK